MNLRERISKLVSDLNPIAMKRNKKRRKQLTNFTPSFLCPNCIGGLLFHDLGIQFCSPTVNLMLLQTDFVKFVTELDYYLAQDLVFFRHHDYACPCAHLADITIHFTHYASEQEARSKWNERASRIDRDNLFIFLQERDGLTEEDLLKFQQVRARGVLIFTAFDYPQVPYALQILNYQSAGEVGNILSRDRLTGQREYDRYFDFVKWFNQANGAPFDITPYIKK